MLGLMMSFTAYSDDVCTCSQWYPTLPANMTVTNISNSLYLFDLHFDFCTRSLGTWTFSWNYGDGSTDSYTLNGPTTSGTIGPVKSHTYTSSGTYNACLTITYNYFKDHEPVSCQRVFCRTIQVQLGEEPCVAEADFSFNQAGNTVVLVDQSNTSGGILAGSIWRIDGQIFTGDILTYHFPLDGLVNVCREVTVYDPVSGECCTDTKCLLLGASDEVQACSMEPDFSYQCYENDCVYTFHGNAGGSNRPVAAWHWSFGDGGTSTQQNATHSYANPGTYQVCLTVVGDDPNGNGCCVKEYCRTITFTCSGVNNTSACDQSGQGPAGPSLKLAPKENATDPQTAVGSALEEVSLMPNPVKDNATLQFEMANAAQTVNIVVMDIMGREAFTVVQNTELAAGSHTYTIPTTNLNSGTYFVRIQADGQTQSLKMVVKP